jgi:hypothetical protein
VIEVNIFGRLTPVTLDDPDDPSSGVREPRNPAPSEDTHSIAVEQ